ncbi:MAG: hypothetical protein QHH12_05715 [Candidatus Bathyarchaeota archaeon]|jgi:hypothetical protein|nr:hypothetical protein [Candidatus Bathyarchaeota archaeon A05DMB-3]MDH7607243.1 hypothetical protein [Candidatus Bathyarchaeota archaeon]
MEKELSLFGKEASNLIGALGEIIAWDVLRKMGIRTYKIGAWNFFPEGYPHFRDRKITFLTRKQTEFVENKVRNNMIEFDFVGVKLKHGLPYVIEVENINDFMNGKTRGKSLSTKKVEDVYLIEVKTGRGANIRHYSKNPIRAFSPENLEKAKAIGFKVALVVVELLENWKCRISYREL